MPDTSSPAVLLSGIAFVLETPDDAARQRFRDILSELALSTKKPVARPTEEHEPRMAIAFSDTMPDLEGMRIRHGGGRITGKSILTVPGAEVVGYFDHAAKAIRLNTTYSDAELAATFEKLALHAFVATALGAEPAHGHVLVSSDELPRLMTPPGHVIFLRPSKPKPPQP